MRIFELIQDSDVVELDVEILVNRFEGAADGDVVLQLDRHGLVGEGLEEGEEQHFWSWWGVVGGLKIYWRRDGVGRWL